MVTIPATPALSVSEAGERALVEAERMLPTTGHHGLLLRAVAAEAGYSHAAIIKQFGSQVGFLAALAARQWDRATAAVAAVPQEILAVAMADITFAVDHPAAFRLMYEHELWQRVNARDAERPVREQAALAMLEEARNTNYGAVSAAFAQERDQLRVRLVASLLTGLSFEFVNEGLYQGHRAEQLDHAEKLLKLALGRDDR